MLPTAYSISMITLRPANEQDAERLFAWRNDPTAYQHFFHGVSVTMEEHLQWLSRALKDPQRHVYIIVNEKEEPIGQVRFDMEGSVAEVSITLGKEARGHGYGKEAIIRSASELFDTEPGIQKIIAQIKAENEGSIAAFERAGYARENTSDGIVHLTCHRHLFRV